MLHTVCIPSSESPIVDKDFTEIDADLTGPELTFSEKVC